MCVDQTSSKEKPQTTEGVWKYTPSDILNFWDAQNPLSSDLCNEFNQLVAYMFLSFKNYGNEQDYVRYSLPVDQL